MQKIMKMKQKLLQMLVKKGSVIITTSISGRGVDIQLRWKKGSIPDDQLKKKKKKLNLLEDYL